MGMGATNTTERVFARLGLVQGVPTQFEHALDVSNAGVLLAIPALLSNGLLRHVDDSFSLPSGYYTLQQIFLLIAFLALCRIKSYEQLRYCTPGEWGKILGLDRIPEVKTFREKISLLSQQKKAEEWSGILCKEWMDAEPESAGTLYIDGHVRVYQGSKTNLPRHYVARQRLCLRATVDYWINAMDGRPFFKINKAVDPGLLSVLREEIVPALERDVPGQPTQEELSANPLLHRFTLVFDREGYSPDFFLEQKQKRIAIVTYHKFPKKDWAPEEFVEYTTSNTINGTPATIQLAERGTRLPNGLWVREIRKCIQNGHQTSLLSTDYLTDLRPIAAELFSRWSQENFFKYMLENYNLDKLIDYSTESIPETTRVINPQYRAIEGQIKSTQATLAKHMNEFAALHLEAAIDPPQVLQFEKDKTDLKLKIDALQERIKHLKENRKTLSRHITVQELPQKDRFNRLSVESKHLIDTIKMIAYRAETALAYTLKEYLGDKEDARMVVKRICQGEADIIPDLKQKILTVRLHHQASASLDTAVRKLFEELNETETVFPGSNLRLSYELIS
jgi:hypothetical protein